MDALTAIFLYSGYKQKQLLFDDVGIECPAFYSLPRYNTERIPTMVIIRLARSGAKKRPFYNVRVADGRKSRDGAFLERVGYFNPSARGGEKRLELNMERIEKWISLGAQPSDRVHRLIKDYALGEEVVAEKRVVKANKKRARVEADRAASKQEALSSTENAAPETAA